MRPFSIHLTPETCRRKPPTKPPDNEISRAYYAARSPDQNSTVQQPLPAKVTPTPSTTMSSTRQTDDRRGRYHDTKDRRDPPPAPYNPVPFYGTTTEALLAGNCIREIHHAEQLFAQRQHAKSAMECNRLCYWIVSRCPSEAVMAKAHAMLADEQVGSGLKNTKTYHAREAVRFWTMVVEQTGLSRFDVGKARVQLSNAEEVLRQRSWSPRRVSNKHLLEELNVVWPSGADPAP